MLDWSDAADIVDVLMLEARHLASEEAMLRMEEMARIRAEAMREEEEAARQAAARRGSQQPSQQKVESEAQSERRPRRTPKGPSYVEQELRSVLPVPSRSASRVIYYVPLTSIFDAPDELVDAESIQQWFGEANPWWIERRLLEAVLSARHERALQFWFILHRMAPETRGRSAVPVTQAIEVLCRYTGLSSRHVRRLIFEDDTAFLPVYAAAGTLRDGTPALYLRSITKVALFYGAPPDGALLLVEPEAFVDGMCSRDVGRLRAFLVALFAGAVQTPVSVQALCAETAYSSRRGMQRALRAAERHGFLEARRNWWEITHSRSRSAIEEYAEKFKKALADAVAGYDPAGRAERAEFVIKRYVRLYYDADDGVWSLRWQLPNSYHTRFRMALGYTARSNALKRWRRYHKRLARAAGEKWTSGGILRSLQAVLLSLVRWEMARGYDGEDASHRGRQTVEELRKARRLWLDDESDPSSHASSSSAAVRYLRAIGERSIGYGWAVRFAALWTALLGGLGARGTSADEQGEEWHDLRSLRNRFPQATRVSAAALRHDVGGVAIPIVRPYMRPIPGSVGVIAKFRVHEGDVLRQELLVTQSPYHVLRRYAPEYKHLSTTADHACNYINWFNPEASGLPLMSPSIDPSRRDRAGYWTPRELNVPYANFRNGDTRPVRCVSGSDSECDLPFLWIQILDAEELRRMTASYSDSYGIFTFPALPRAYPGQLFQKLSWVQHWSADHTSALKQMVVVRPRTPEVVCKMRVGELGYLPSWVLGTKWERYVLRTWMALWRMSYGSPRRRGWDIDDLEVVHPGGRCETLVARLQALADEEEVPSTTIT